MGDSDDITQLPLSDDFPPPGKRKPKPSKPRSKSAARPPGRGEPDWQIICSFCGKSRRQVAKLVAGPGVYICDECLSMCVDIVEEDGFRLPRINQLPEDLSPIFGPPAPPLAKHCFYLGPFSEPFDSIYRDHVHGPLTADGFTVERADEIFSTGVVVSDIWNGITGASLVVADLTGKNPNVLYEVGIAHAVGRPVAILTQSMEDVPFDLRHRRCIVYQHTPRGAASLETRLLKTVRLVCA